MRRKLVVVALGCLLPSTPAVAQKDFTPRTPKVPAADVESAIRKGLAYLKTAHSPVGNEGATSDEFILYTLLHGGLPREDPVFQATLKKVVDKGPAKTYSVACAAMCLAELDKVGYRWKLEQYARFLVNTQCKNGQWSYGEANVVESVPPPAAPPPKTVASGAVSASAQPAAPAPLYGVRYPAGASPGDGKGGGTTARRRIPQTRRGPEAGDNSNSQYAALGLRACAEAGLEIDPKCVQDAVRWWEQSQNSDGGWGYDAKGAKDPSWGSMTMGGIGALAIYDWMLRQPWKKDARIHKAIQWLAANWTVTANPKGKEERKEHWHDYYLYALERAGMIYGTDEFGPHDWYDEGAKHLLKNQKPDGSWKAEGEIDAEKRDAWDTCFAILFLRRATRPLVYTGPGN